MNYKNARWYKLRESILKRDNYTCQICKRYGKTKQAEMVHHIVPADKVMEYRYLKENLISLCNVCHNTLHSRDTQELTRSGRELQDKHIDKIEKAYKRQKELLHGKD